MTAYDLTESSAVLFSRFSSAFICKKKCKKKPNVNKVSGNFFFCKKKGPF